MSVQNVTDTNRSLMPLNIAAQPDTIDPAGPLVMEVEEVGANSHLLPPAYYQAIENLKAHLNALVNISVRRDVSKAFRDFLGGVIDIQRGISHLFTEDAFVGGMAKDTRRLIDEVDRAMKSYAGKGNVIEKLKPLRDSLIPLSQPVQHPTWDLLDVFFNIPQIRMLDNSEMTRIMYSIDQSDIQRVRTQINEKFEEEEIEVMDDFLKAQGLDDVSTLVAEMIDKKPNQTGILSNWEKDPSFFIRKTVHLQDPITGQPFHGSVVRCEKEANNTIRFFLKDGTEIEISRSCEVVVKENITHKMMYAIREGIIKQEVALKVGFDGLEADCKIEKGSCICTSFNSSQSTGEQMPHHHIDTLVFTYESGVKARLTLQINDTERAVISAKIAYMPSDESQYLPDETIEPDQFMRCYSTTTQTIYKLRSINRENIEKNFHLTQEEQRVDEFYYLKEIHNQLSEIQKELARKENRDLLNELLDNLIMPPFLTITLDKLESQKPHLVERIKDVSRQYKTNLSMERSPEEILKTILLKTNHSIVIKKEQGVQVAERMRMLEEAYQHAKALEGKHAVLFMGNTGCGKSTSVAYYQGARTRTAENAVRDKVITITGDASRYPKVGQSLAESETVYTKGFPIIDQDKLNNFDQLLILADSAGFSDTRGDDFEIVTNMSIDCAMRSIGELRAIVVTIPIHSFLDGRVNHVIELIDAVRDRFPFAFTDSPANRHVFLLITKQIQSQAGTVQSLKDGTRFQKLLQEATAAQRKEMEKIQGLASGTSGLNHYYLTSLEKRAIIWKTLISMRENGQVEMIDTLNRDARRKFLDRLSKLQGGIDLREGIEQNKNYIPAMQTLRMQKKFGDDLELAADTWNTLMLTPYLELLPAKLVSIEKSITDQTTEIEYYQKEQANNELCLAKITLSKTELERLDREGGDVGGLQPDVQGRIKTLLDARMQSLEKGKDRFLENETLLNMKINIKTEELGEQIASRVIQEKKKSDLEQKILEAREGVHTDMLWERDYRGKEHEELPLFDWVSSEAKMKYFRNEISWEEATKDFRKITRKNYRGDSSVVAKIERDYQLIPSEPAMREIFATQILNMRTWSSDDFRADLKGECFSIDLGVHIMMEGKKINYSFLTHWDGLKMPWITITHSIPNTEFKASEILNYRAQIGTCTGLIEEYNRKISQIVGDISAKRAEIKALKDGEAKREMDLYRLASSQALEDLQQSMQEEIDYLEFRQTILPIRIEKAEREKEMFETELEEQKKLRRNLALIIHTEKESGYQLKAFIQEVLQGRQKTAGEESSMITTCKKFLETFIKAEEMCVFEACARDLCLSLEQEQPTTGARAIVSGKGKERMI